MIVDVLLRRAMLSPLTMLTSGSTLGRYSLYVLRYCFFEEQQIEPVAAEQIFRIAADLTPERKEVLRGILATTR